MAREDLLGGNPLEQLASSGVVRQLRRQQLLPASWQPRRRFDREPLLALARSVRTEGVRQNLVVRPHPQQPGLYEIIAGERRWRATDPQIEQTLNLTAQEKESLLGTPPTTLPCLITNLDDRAARKLSAVENLQRENLDVIDEASYRLLLIQDALDYAPTPAATQQDIAQELGRRLHAFRRHPEQHQPEIAQVERLFAELGTLSWASFTTNHLPLLQLPEHLLSAVKSGQLPGRSALLIARQEGALQESLLAQALAGASFQELTAAVHAHEGQSWRVTAAAVRSRLGSRQLEKLPEAQKQRVMKLLAALHQELENTEAASDS